MAGPGSGQGEAGTRAAADQGAPPPQSEAAAGAGFDPVAEARQRYPGLSGWSDQQVMDKLMNPDGFRQAFPEYGHLDDQTIRGNMAHYFKQTSAQPAPEAESAGPVSRFLHNAVQSVTGAGSLQDVENGITQGLPYMVEHPIESAKLLAGSAWDAQKGEAHQAAAAAHDAMDAQLPLSQRIARATEAFGHGVAAAVPMVGPAAAAAGEQIGGGDVAGGLGSAAGLLAPFGAKTAADALKTTASTVREAPAALADKALNNSVTMKILGGGPEEMAKTPPATDEPLLGTASKGEVADYANQKGVTLLPGQATESRPLQALQAVGERALIGGKQLQEHAETQRANFAKAVDDFSARMGAASYPDAQTAGTALKQSVEDAMQKLKQEAQQGYEDWSKKVGDIQVDLGDLGKKYAQKLGQMQTALENIPDRYANPIRALLNKASDFGKTNTVMVDTGLKDEFGRPITRLEQRGATPTVADLQQMRSAYWNIAHDFSGNIPERVNAVASEIVSDLDQKLSQVAKQTGTLKSWRKANALWKQLHEDFDAGGSPFGHVLRQTDPERVASWAAERGNLGGSRTRLAALRKYNIDLDPVRATVTKAIADRSFGLRGNKLAGYHPEFLRDLYDHASLEELKKLGRIGRAIKYEANPSGTSNVLESGRQIRELARKLPEAGLIGLGGLMGGVPGAMAGATLALPAETIPARLMLNPDFIESTTGIRPAGAELRAAPALRPPRSIGYGLSPKVATATGTATLGPRKVAR